MPGGCAKYAAGGPRRLHEGMTAGCHWRGTPGTGALRGMSVMRRGRAGAGEQAAPTDQGPPVDPGVHAMGHVHAQHGNPGLLLARAGRGAGAEANVCVECRTACALQDLRLCRAGSGRAGKACSASYRPACIHRFWGLGARRHSGGALAGACGTFLGSVGVRSPGPALCCCARHALHCLGAPWVTRSLLLPAHQNALPARGAVPGASGNTCL